MKRVTKQQFSFFGRSLLWSLLLYFVTMLVFNWDEVRNTVKGKEAVTIITGTHYGVPPTYNPQTLPVDISEQTGIIKSIGSLFKNITGIFRFTGMTGDH